MCFKMSNYRCLSNFYGKMLPYQKNGSIFRAAEFLILHYSNFQIEILALINDRNSRLNKTITAVRKC